MSSDHLAPARLESLYFAYGSNLAFGQMASRCPSSVFVGRGRLHNYKFQINERGFANVIPSSDPSSFIDGLCYRLSPSDEQNLDRAEGVPVAYEKHLLEVEFWAARAELLGRTVVNIVDWRNQNVEGQNYAEMKGQGSTTGSTKLSQELTGSPHPNISGPSEGKARLKPFGDGSTTKMEEIIRGESVTALVYISSSYTKNGLPWDEYIHRMEVGLDEALALGISREYVAQYVQPFLEFGRGKR